VRGRTSAYPFRAGTPATVGRQRSSGLPTFGQPTIAGIGGFGFEADLRLDPTDPSRIYMSVPGTGGADTSWIWRSLDGGRTFKWVPAAAPLNGKATVCVGGGDTELPSTRREYQRPLARELLPRRARRPWTTPQQHGRGRRPPWK
jgi:hypothetical protein